MAKAPKPVEASALADQLPLIDHGDAHGVGATPTRTIEDKYLPKDMTGEPIRIEPVKPTGSIVHRVLAKVRVP